MTAANHTNICQRLMLLTDQPWQWNAEQETYSCVRGTDTAIARLNENNLKFGQTDLGFHRWRLVMKEADAAPVAKLSLRVNQAYPVADNTPDEPVPSETPPAAANPVPSPSEAMAEMPAQQPVPMAADKPKAAPATGKRSKHWAPLLQKEFGGSWTVDRNGNACHATFEHNLGFKASAVLDRLSLRNCIESTGAALTLRIDHTPEAILRAAERDYNVQRHLSSSAKQTIVERMHAGCYEPRRGASKSMIL